MKTITMVLNWLFGIFLAITAIGFLVKDIATGLIMFAISCFFLPPVRNFLHNKTNISLQPKIKAVIILFLLIPFFYFINISTEKDIAEFKVKEAKEKAENDQQQKEKTIKYFSDNKEIIYIDIESEIDKKNYRKAVAIAKKYYLTNDEIILSLHNIAKSQEIISSLKTISATNLKQNKKLYQELVKLNPDNQKYKEKLAYYSGEIRAKSEKERIEKEKDRKERETRIAKFGEQPTQSSWDGSYYSVERYLERVANDPDSIKMDGCTKVYYTENGWLVGCDYRGSNAFGGMIRQSNWFTIVHGTVTQMHEASAYTP